MVISAHSKECEVICSSEHVSLCSILKYFLKVYMFYVRFPTYFIVYYHPKKLIFINPFYVHPIPVSEFVYSFYSYQIT